MLWYCRKCKEWKIHEDLVLTWYNERGRYYYKCRKCRKQYRDDNPEYYIHWKKTNREDDLEHKKKWRDDNKEEFRNGVRYSNINRNAAKYNAPGSFTEEEFQELLALYDYKCLACGKELFSDKDTHRDHIVPFSKGGSNFIDNIQPLCSTCNQSKGNKTTDYRENN